MIKSPKWVNHVFTVFGSSLDYPGRNNLGQNLYLLSKKGKIVPMVYLDLYNKDPKFSQAWINPYKHVGTELEKVERIAGKGNFSVYLQAYGGNEQFREAMEEIGLTKQDVISESIRAANDYGSPYILWNGRKTVPSRYSSIGLATELDDDVIELTNVQNNKLVKK